MPSPLTMLRDLQRHALYKGKNYAAGLSGREREVLDNYVSGHLSGNYGEHAVGLNEALRKRQTPEVAGVLDEILRRAPKSDSPLVLYRGMPVFENPRTVRGYSSTSIEPDIADSYAEVGNDTWLPKILFGRSRLEVPPGAPLVSPDISEMFDESELLLPRGLRFEPQGRDVGDNNKMWYGYKVGLPYRHGGLARASMQ